MTKPVTILAAAGAALLLIAATPPAPAPSALDAGNQAWLKKDYAAAVNAWRPLADRGDAYAQFNMGQAYKLGRGVPTNLSIAQSWYQKAAQQGLAKAQDNLGLLLYNGGKRKEAMPWLTKAAERGEPRAQYVMGTELFNGDHVTKDWPRAYALTMRAAAHGLPPAADNIAMMDKYIPADQRQKGVALARQIEVSEKSAGAAATARAALPAASTVLKPAEAPVRAATTTPAAKPTPKPTTIRPVVPAAKPVVAAEGRWKVQLGAFDSPAIARRQWALISGKLAAVAGLQPSYEQAGKFTRLRVGPLASRGDANRICAAAKAAGQDCFTVAP